METTIYQEGEKPHVFADDLPKSHSVVYSLFNTCKDAYPKQKTSTFDGLADLCRTPAIRAEKDGKAFSPAIFRGSRANKNAVACGFLAFDLDNLPESVTAAEVLKCAEGLLAFAYSSHNHLVPGKGARFRCVVAVNAPIPAEIYRAVLTAFAKRFPWAGAVDEKCFDPARLFYFPSCPADRVHLFENEAREGSLFDWQALGDTHALPVAAKSLVGASSPFAGIPSNLVQRPKREIAEGGRNDSLFRIGSAMRGEGKELDEIAGELMQRNSELCRPPLDAAEVITIAQSVCKYAPGKPSPLPPAVMQSEARFEMPRAFTELAVAEAVNKTFGGGFHYVAESGKWLVFDSASGLWVDDSNGQIKRWIFGLFAYAKEESFNLLRVGDERGKRVLNEVLKAEKSHFVSGAISLMQALQGVTIKADILDSDKYLVGLRGGKCVDLNSEVIREITQDDFLSKTLGVEYQENAKCDLWELVILEWCCGDVQLVKFLQVFIGYCLSGETTFQGFLFLHGQGRNGKSVFVQIIESLLGDYAKTLNSEALMLKHGDGGTNNDIARLAGARFVKSVELPEERQLNENLVKQMVGGDTLTARFLYGEWFELVPQFKLVIVGNHRPIIRGTDEGVWRRVHLVPFNAVIKAVDHDLTAKLLKEMPGILNWSLNGWKAYQKEGLKIPEIVKAESTAYRNDSDIVGRFLGECCEFGNLFEITAKELYLNFKDWNENSGLRAGSNISFGRRLEGRLNSRRGSNGMVYEGIKLKNWRC